MLTVRAPAKINWLLHVVGRRDDGYHEIRSLIQLIDLSDSISFEQARDISLETNMTGTPVAENLVYRAALLLKGHTGCGAGVKIRLEKNIPVEAGLGGGSSDAAASLLALNELWGLGLAREDLSLLGVRLGSDIPFFLSGAAALVSGRGEKCVPLQLGEPMNMLVVKPPAGVSARWAYGALTGYSELTKSDENIRIFTQALREGDFSRLRAHGWNDLEQAVLRKCPEVGRIKAALFEKGALYAGMSGSGSAVFGVFPDRPSAQEARKGMDWWCRVACSVA
jgi:4-diphosphocytidyl-2-C-methyl-D-erythritol kinase